MKFNKSILKIMLLLSVLNVQAAYGSDFKATDLSKEGQHAYTKLLDVRTFSIGLVGWSANQSPNELALRTLLREKKAIKALKSLMFNATPEGSLYGLFGLRMVNIKTFIQELAAYKAKPEPPERYKYAIVNPEIPSRFSKVRSGEVMVQRGCIVNNSQWKKVVSRIEEGQYDETFRLNKMGFDYVLEDGTVVKKSD